MQDDSVLDDAERLRTFTGAMLAREADPELQEIVRRAAEVSRHPIALVSLVLRRTQLFAAHVGLPSDLAVTRATDRCVSFCQFVVRSGDVVEVDDARVREDLPQDLVQAYGIRAYTGFPLRVGGHVLGSLCVIDVEPRVVDPDTRGELEALAERASRRLAQLASDGADVRRVLSHAAEPALAELRSTAAALVAQARAARIATAEMQPAIDLVTRAKQHGLTAEQIARASSVLVHAQRARQDLDRALEEQERSTDRILDRVDAFACLLQTTREVTTLAHAVDGALKLAHAATKMVGGVRVGVLDASLRVPLSSVTATAIVAVVLRAVADRALLPRLDGIDVRCEATAGPALVFHAAWLDGEGARQICEELSSVFGATSGARFEARAPAAIAVRWP